MDTTKLAMILREVEEGLNQYDIMYEPLKEKLEFNRLKRGIEIKDAIVSDEEDKLAIKMEIIKAYKGVLEHDCKNANINLNGISPDIASHKLSEVTKKWFNNQLKLGKWRDGGQKVKEQLDNLLFCTKDKPINYYTIDDVENIRDTLLTIPTNRKKYSIFNGLNSKAIVEANSKLPTPKPTFAASTVKKTIEVLYNIFDYAHTRGYCKKNPVLLKDLTAISPQQKGEKLRDAFSQEDLKRFFTHYELISKLNPKNLHEKPLWIWLPLIAMFNGLRITEICQLHTRDIIKLENNVYCFDINQDDKATTFKKLKNRNAKRVIPIHNYLIKCGFIKFIELQKAKNEERLFSELKLTNLVKKKGWGDYPIKQMSGYIRRWVTKDQRKVFHSTRHAFITALIAKKPQFFIINQSLVGHANQSVTMRSYNETVFWDTSYEIVNSVAYEMLEPEASMLKNALSDFYSNIDLSLLEKE